MIACSMPCSNMPDTLLSTTFPEGSRSVRLRHSTAMRSRRGTSNSRTSSTDSFACGGGGSALARALLWCWTLDGLRSLQQVGQLALKWLIGVRWPVCRACGGWGPERGGSSQGWGEGVRQGVQQKAGGWWGSASGGGRVSGAQGNEGARGPRE